MNNKSSQTLDYAAAALILLVLFGPITWLIISSLQPEINLITGSLKVEDISFKSYHEVLFGGTPESSTFRRGIINSAIVGILVTMICIVLGTHAAYAFSKFTFRGQDLLLFLIFSVQMIPAIVIGIPLFLQFNRFGLLDTLLAVIFAQLTFTLPSVIWILRGFFESFPRELVDASLVDGCGMLQSFYRIILPGSTAAIISISIFAFIMSWNDFFFAFILTKSKSVTLPVALTGYASYYVLDWVSMSAAAIISIIPVIIMALLFNRYIVRGILKGAIKG